MFGNQPRRSVMQKREDGLASDSTITRTSVRGPWTWYVSALFYRLLYERVAHEADDNLFDSLRELGHTLSDETVADCGCGPGVVVKKLLARGVGRVVAIDSNRVMIRQVERLEDLDGRVVAEVDTYGRTTLARINRVFLRGKGYDVILFKRSLYMGEEEAIKILRNVWQTLAPRGVIAIVHPELSLKGYAFGGRYYITRYTLGHLLNRAISRLTQPEYRLYTKDGLKSFAEKALPDATVSFGKMTQSAFIIVLMQKV
jgi:SAM-dependent methyltransferase